MIKPRLRRSLIWLGVLAILYILIAYIVAPALWRHYEHHPVMQSAPKTTMTAEGFAGDPLNIGIVGTKPEVVRALIAAGWRPADPTTFHTSVGIVASVLLKRPDSTAPVSSLFLFGRRQDMAFERAVGRSARERHHVRLWQADSLGTGGRPLWLGGATFDRAVGVSHRTGQVTHHISADIDAERDTLVAGLSNAGQLAEAYQVTGVGPTLFGRNGGGDRYYTDGEVTVAVLTRDNAPGDAPVLQTNPPAVAAKNRFWRWLRGIL